MTSINSWCLYYVSFVPLWLAILFIDIKNIVDKKQNLYTEKISIIAIVVLFIISLIIVRRLIIDKRRSGAEKYIIIEAKKSKDITIEYFLAYVLPLFAFDKICGLAFTCSLIANPTSIFLWTIKNIPKTSTPPTIVAKIRNNTWLNLVFVWVLFSSLSGWTTSFVPFS